MRPTILLVTVRRYRCADCGTCGAHPGAATSTFTVIIDLTAVRAKTGPPGCSTWSKDGPNKPSRPGCPKGRKPGATAIEVVAMDGFTGFKTATTEKLPDASR